MALNEAVAALEAGDGEEALQAVLAAWREHPSVELERLLFALSAWADSGLERLPTESWEEAWDDVAQAGRAVDVPRLLERVADGALSRLTLRMDRLAPFGSDPRIGEAFLRMIEVPPTTSTSNASVWVKLFAQIQGCLDARAVPRLEARAATHDGASQFWPKHSNRCLALAGKLAAPVPMPPDQAAVVASLETQLAELIAAGPPTIAAAPAPVTVGWSEAQGLGVALARLVDGDPEEALDHLVATWADHRVPALTEAIERLSALVPGVPIAGSSSKEFHQHWLEAAVHPRPARVQVLLSSAHTGSAGEIEVRVEAMLKWRPDPRVARFMDAVFADTNLGARKRLWSAVLDNVVHHADPETRERFEGRERRYAEPGILHRYTEIRSQLRRVSADYHAAVDRRWALTPVDEAVLPELQAAIEAFALVQEAHGASEAGAEAALVAAILANPEADEPRLVYADWLIEHGEPRGEFLLLDVQLAAGKKVAGKRNKAARAHEASIRGPLAAICGWGCDYERGFLGKLRLDLRGLPALSEPQRDVLFTDLRWNFVRTLACSHTGNNAEVLVRAPLGTLHTLQGADLEALIAMTSRSDTLLVRSLEIAPGRNPPPALFEALGPLADRLPALHEVQITIWGEDDTHLTPPEAFFASPLLRNVAVVRTSGPTTSGRCLVHEWLARMHSMGCAVPTFSLVAPVFELSATLEPDGRRRVSLEPTSPLHARGFEELRTLLGALEPTTVSEVRVRWSDTTAPDQRQALLDALRVPVVVVA